VAGKPWWIGVGAACGLVVGLTKAVLRLDEIPTFIEEIQSQKVDPITSVKVPWDVLDSLNVVPAF
jgi:hypothetical protein